MFTIMFKNEEKLPEIACADRIYVNPANIVDIIIEMDCLPIKISISHKNQTECNNHIFEMFKQLSENNCLNIFDEKVTIIPEELDDEDAVLDLLNAYYDNITNEDDDFDTEDFPDMTKLGNMNKPNFNITKGGLS